MYLLTNYFVPIELSFSGYTPIIPAKMNIEVSPNINKVITLLL